MFINPRRTGIALMGLFFSGLMFSHTAAAGVSTQQESATSPDYAGFQLSTVVLRIDSDDPDRKIVLEHYLKKELANKGITVHLYDDVFPATQAWNDESMREVSEALSVDGIMHVQHVSDAASHDASTQTQRVRYSETSMPTRSDQPSGRYGGGPAGAVGISGDSFSGYTTGTHAQTAQYQVALMESTQGHEVWRSSIETRVTGNHSKHQKTAKSTAEAIIRGLTEGEHLPQD